MDGGTSGERFARGKRASTDKAWRTVLLAVLFHTYWPQRLSRDEIIKKLSAFYGETAIPALYRDLATLTGCKVEELPKPDSEWLAEWCAEQEQLGFMAISYDREKGTFGLERSLFAIDISEEEARAFAALQEGFSPGTPYAGAVQHLLRRWEWLFSEKSRRLVQQKRKRRAHPVQLPLSPVVDYSQHTDTILALDQALEDGAYVSFAYTPLAGETVTHERVEPYELEYRDGHWYFTAYVRDLNTFLDYRVDRISPGSLSLDKDRFLPGNRRRPGVKIRYWVSPMLARHGSLSARLRDQQVTMLENDGGAIVEGTARSLWWARRLLLGYGEQVKALEPPELVAMMRESAGSMCRMYEEEQ
ncbi:MAG TPA: WYL domain-containing protein [Ktedonobacteraceae bacterium]|jgi:predicted DNA-binding transcriptional regulator YafY|nr:WYL domain-containing protein [Ktedonobacteraceae bacterium]